MIKIDLQFASFSEIHDIVLRMRSQSAEYKNLTDLYFLWHPRTEYDFLRSYNDAVNPNLRPQLTDGSDIIAEIQGVKIHSYTSRNAEEKALIIFQALNP